jgi:hypothetical protein
MNIKLIEQARWQVAVSTAACKGPVSFPAKRERAIEILVDLYELLAKTESMARRIVVGPALEQQR